MRKDFVLEIGTEEIPARFMGPAIKQLEELALEWLKSHRLGYDAVSAMGTPRRLTVYISGLAEKQEEFTEEVKGPSQKAAYDAEGNPTRAVEGFARGQGVNVSDLISKETPSGEYVYAIKTTAGRMTEALLPEFCQALIHGLSFPKPMRWGNQEMRFARPIKWLLCLFDKDVVAFEIEGLSSGRITRGHRFLSKEPIELAAASEYREKLRSRYVIVDQGERKQMIWEQITALAVQEGGRVEPDEELLDEVTHLLEYPTALCGTFSVDYLRLPKEVLITPMREHQRYFPVIGSDDRLLAKFITVRNGTEEFIDVVRGGNEKVLRARLADAEFFYVEDMKVPLRNNIEKLKKIVFHEKLGTIYEKVERIETLSGYLAEENKIDNQETKDDIKQSAYLCKTDLVTNMVYEFPELQGIMGREYAIRGGEKKAVAEAIFEHYLPRFSGDIFPATDAGRMISISDKIDTIVGCFAVGIQPTGSQDPYALRRQALGICHIGVDAKVNYSLKGLIEKSYGLYAGKIQAKLSLEETLDEVQEFFKQRMKNILTDRGYSYDIIEAVLASGFDRIYDTIIRAEALANLRRQDIFAKLLTAYTRAANLAKNAVSDQIHPDLLQDETEKALYSEYQKAREEMQVYLGEGQYRQYLQRFALLQTYIDSFFEAVMVMVEDEGVKNNRLALLKSIADLIRPVADLTKIVA